MGSSLSAMVAAQPEETRAQVQNELDALLTRADLSNQAFTDAVKDNARASTVPVDNILMKGYRVSAGVTHDANDIKNAVAAVDKGFIGGASITGIIGVGLHAVLGNNAANLSEHTTYAIAGNEFGGMGRIDIKIVCYSFPVVAHTGAPNNVVAVAYTISSADTSKLDPNILHNIVETCYSGAITPQGTPKLEQSKILSVPLVNGTRALASPPFETLSELNGQTELRERSRGVQPIRRLLWQVLLPLRGEGWIQGAASRSDLQSVLDSFVDSCTGINSGLRKLESLNVTEADTSGEGAGSSGEGAVRPELSVGSLGIVFVLGLACIEILL
ncbi:hypothetical protein C8R43DRAFT_1230914 [Mycena crocata]|nr:hypothetical protein C8R43DRAFT_1230914 [Mycena crocata]